MRQVTMYLFIQSNGTITEQEGLPDLDTIQALTGGGYCEVATLRLPATGEVATAWFGEDAKAKHERVNAHVTRWAHDSRAIRLSDWIAGDVVLTGGASDEGDVLSLSPDWLDWVRDHTGPVTEEAGA